MTQQSINPYLPPAQTAATREPTESRFPAWPKWLIGGVVLEYVAVVTVMICERTGVFSSGGGELCMIVSGIGLFLACIPVGLKYNAKEAFIIGQLLNVTVWTTMMVSVVTMLPILLGHTLNRGAYNYFLMAGLSGSVGMAIVIGVFGLFRGSSSQVLD